MSKKRQFNRDIDGILLLDKPSGLSSSQAVQFARELFRATKAGHTGSLDPLATGLLPICFGEATKIAGFLLGARKAYEVECQLGITTTTDDAEGTVLLERSVPVFSITQINAVLALLRGTIVQVPPIYSAIKQGGKPSYKRARRGEAVQPPPRSVEVFRLELLEQEPLRLRLLVECGSGTYVRSLVRDLGEYLNCGAYVIGLRRLWVEPFLRPQMISLQQLRERMMRQGLAAIDAYLIPVSAGLTNMPAVQLDEAQSLALRNGLRVAVAMAPAPGTYQARDERDQLIGLVEFTEQGWLRVVRGFNLTPKSEIKLSDG